MPDELIGQMPLIKEVLKAFDIKILEVDGYEADDIIATLASAASNKFNETLIVSSDKDILQLVSKKVKVMSIKKGITDTIIFKEEKVIEKFGIIPGKIKDFLALTGDSSDNIPGVPGIGAKTAAKLLQQWQSLANALDHVDAIEPEKARRSLAEHRELIARNLALLRLQTDINCGASLADMQARPPDAGGLLAFYEEMEFHTLAKALREPTLF